MPVCADPGVAFCNTLGSYRPDGTIKTFFKPTSTDHWSRQPGQWFRETLVSALIRCPVCGYPGPTEEPRTEGGGSFEICPSCGFEFGVTDDDEGFDYGQWRSRWVAEGARWWSSQEEAPVGWDYRDYLRPEQL